MKTVVHICISFVSYLYNVHVSRFMCLVVPTYSAIIINLNKKFGDFISLHSARFGYFFKMVVEQTTHWCQLVRHQKKFTLLGCCIFKVVTDSTNFLELHMFLLNTTYYFDINQVRAWVSKHQFTYATYTILNQFLIIYFKIPKSFCLNKKVYEKSM